jgi:Uma2 family endonuclease
MVAVRQPPRVTLPVEQRVLARGVSWKDYMLLREALDTPGLRMTYCQGALEIARPSRAHELWKKTIARLVELVAIELGIPLVGYGSTTFKPEAQERGAEPDECYRVGTLMSDGKFPDIVLEVTHESPLLDKLYVYSGFEVPEVWLFEKGRFRLFGLKDGTYVAMKHSRLLPQLDFALIARFALREDQRIALQELRDILRRPPAAARSKARRSRRR